MRDFVFNIGGLVGLQEYLNNIFQRDTNYFKCPDPRVFSNDGIIINNISISPIITNFSAKIRPRKLTVISGEVGCGKSTLIKAILQSQPLHSGNIYIGNKSLGSLSPSCVRSNIGFVPQHPNMFNRAILENITYGTAKTEKDVVSLLHQWRFDDIKVNDLKRMAGKNGCNLSGGQKQLVTILRVLLKDVSIMILDEPTASLSENTKYKVMVMLKSLASSGKMVIVVSHDKDVMGVADDVIVLENRRSF